MKTEAKRNLVPTASSEECQTLLACSLYMYRKKATACQGYWIVFERFQHNAIHKTSMYIEKAMMCSF